MGQFPAISRMVLRGDVARGEVVSVRRVSLEELREGKVGGGGQMSQRGDVKAFGAGGEAALLAAGRCVVEFTEKPGESMAADLGKYRRGTAVVSSTGQLAWDTGGVGGGCAAINTPGTKGVVGFAEGKEIALGEVTITMKSPFGSVLVTALGKNETLKNARAVLVTAVARNANKGFRYVPGKGKGGQEEIVENGKGPIMIEPVKCEVQVHGRKVRKVVVLDQDGRETVKTVAVGEGGRVEIDTGKEKTIYFEVEME
jgi:hypothetical protein